MRLGKCVLMDVPRIGDERGSISFLENETHLPFILQRVYYLYNLPEGAQRGGHAHLALEQLLIPVTGSFDVLLDDGFEKKKISLNNPCRGLYICPMVWREIDNFSKNSVCLVLASAKYDENDYLRQYENFLQAVEV